MGDSTMARGPLRLSQKPSPTTLAATTGTLLTAMDTMARGLLMLSQRPSPTTLAATTVDMVVTDLAMVMDSTMARGPLMLSQKPSPTTLVATTGTLLTATDTSMASKHVWNHSNNLK